MQNAKCKKLFAFCILHWRAMSDELVPPEPDEQPDPRNRLNDLNGREWTYALRSVIATRYPTNGAEGYAHALRRAHPSPKPPQLMAELIRFFTKKGGRVLDPFAGVGGTLLACALEERRGVGVELSPEYAAIYREVCARLGLAPQPLIVGDARRMAEYDLIRGEPFDLILTDPPYAQMMAKPKPRGYLVLFAKDMQPTREHHNMLHADIVEALMELPDLSFRGYRIWHDMSQNLYPFGYPFAFVSNQVHQFILIFRKED